MKVHIVGNRFNAYDKMFRKAGHTVVANLEDADLVQFTGGADVDPIFYNRLEHPRTSCDFDRDKRESIQYGLAKSLNKKIAGVCRGAQFLTVMAGHELWQDVTHHANVAGHSIVDKFTKQVRHVTSTHHQMMRLNDKGGEAIVIATAGHIAQRKSCVEEDEFIYDFFAKDKKHREEMGEDLEVVFYPGENSLAFQPHPEFEKGECRNYYFEVLSRYLNFN
jgi:gamma-glutamyl-gamma-aminobutyrate hydrolase PuuD